MVTGASLLAICDLGGENNFTTDCRDKERIGLKVNGCNELAAFCPLDSCIHRVTGELFEATELTALRLMRRGLVDSFCFDC